MTNFNTMAPNERIYCSKETRKGVRGINNGVKRGDIDTISLIIALSTRFKKEFRIEYPGLFYVLTIYNEVKTKDRLISVFGVLTKLKMGSNSVTLTSIRSSLNRLCDKGLLYCVLQKSNQRYYYGVTQLAIDIIDQYNVVIPEQSPVAC